MAAVPPPPPSYLYLLAFYGAYQLFMWFHSRLRRMRPLLQLIRLGTALDTKEFRVARSHSSILLSLSAALASAMEVPPFAENHIPEMLHSHFVPAVS
jgi:hypothetical protein